MAKPTEKKKTLPLFEVSAVFTDSSRRTQYINCGVVWASEKGAVLVMSSEPKGDFGDWDQKTFIGFPVKGNKKAVDLLCNKGVETEDGRQLPLMTFKAVYSTVDRRQRFIECGRAFIGNESKLVITLDAQPVGDLGDWDRSSYVGMLSEAKSLQAVS